MHCVRQSIICVQAGYIRGEVNDFALLVERHDELDTAVRLIPQRRIYMHLE